MWSKIPELKNDLLRIYHYWNAYIKGTTINIMIRNQGNYCQHYSDCAVLWFFLLNER